MLALSHGVIKNPTHHFPLGDISTPEAGSLNIFLPHSYIYPYFSGRAITRLVCSIFMLFRSGQ
ncbi:hypothetical protein CBM2609_B90002 [Cupriavidus taiwanensis]|nr:hypothetical protein CBM2609_B90002 [Cupriavidus taiwanensis]SOZ48801.1 hypothetical protein CBM2610_B70002 [Cupriavidus taiwanensis]